MSRRDRLLESAAMTPSPMAMKPHGNKPRPWWPWSESWRDRIYAQMQAEHAEAMALLNDQLATPAPRAPRKRRLR